MAEPREPARPPRPPDEAPEAPADARLDAAVRAAYREPAPADAAARDRLLARLAGDAADAAGGRDSPGRRAGGLRWWLAPRVVELRPAWVVAGLAAALALGVGLGARFGVPPAKLPGEPAPEPRATAATGGPVTFVLRAPGASRVSVVGDFNNWDAEATPMAHAGSGDLWILSLELPRGVHLYSFVLDGTEWRPDPSAPLAAGDGFGGHNSVVVVNGAKGL